MSGPEPVPADAVPFVTVVMPVRGEGGFIEQSLGAVLAQDWPADRLEVIYVSDGDMDAQAALIREFKLEDATYVVGPEVGMTYQIGKLPYAALIDKAGTLRAKGLVNSREHLDSLFETEHLGSATLQQYLHAGHAHGHSHSAQQ